MTLIMKRMNYFHLFYYVLNYFFRICKQCFFIKFFFKPQIEAIFDVYNYSPSKKERNKIFYYYVLFNHVVNCENYLSIKKKTLSSIEAKRIAYMSVLATLFDDFIDEDKLDKKTLLAIVTKKIPERKKTPEMHVFFEMDTALEKIVAPTSFYSTQRQLALMWEINSERQCDPSISLNEIISLVENKNGNSSLLWASILTEEWTALDKEFIYQSGIVGQFVNDAFDAFKDRQDGIHTYIHKTTSLAHAKALFIDACRLLNTKIMACKAPEKNKLITIRRFACIHSFGLVALEHLEKIDSHYTKPLQWNLIERKDLITDMGLYKNWSTLFKHTIFLANLS